MRSAAEIAKSLGRAERHGREWRCLCPLHGGHSLCLRDGDAGLLITCWNGCNGEDVLRELRSRGLIEEPDNHYARQHRHLRVASRNEHPQEPRADDKIRGARARWSAASLAHPHLRAYLEDARGIANSSNPSIRYSPAFDYAPDVLLPAMIAALLSPARDIIAVQATFLDPSKPRKAQVATQKRTFGVMGSGAVRLGKATHALGLAEGVEDALSAMQLTGVPCWACLGSQRMHLVAIPPEISELHIFADDDTPGRAAAERTAAAHPNLRRFIRLPPLGAKDWNDVLIAQREGEFLEVPEVA